MARAKTCNRVLAIDPGNTESAWVLLGANARLLEFKKEPNEILIERLRNLEFLEADIFIEMVASYGMPVGVEIFDTCAWIGRFEEACGIATRLYRKDVKLYLCQDSRANDASIRQALIDRYGPEKSIAIGTKKVPGPLYGVSGDIWAALAIAVMAYDGA
jgi:hypothetical protein